MKKMFFIDAGTTWSKIVVLNDNKEFYNEYKNYFVKSTGIKSYYILPSNLIKQMDIAFDCTTTGHMAKLKNINPNNHYNEIIALANGVREKIKNEKNAIILDLGSRDSKWIRFIDGKFSDLDWNASCGSSTGATIEMLLKFYDLKSCDIKYQNEKYNVTCGIFAFEKIMDDISNGLTSDVAIGRLIHGIAYNSFCFANKPKKIYLSGGFCNFDAYLTSLKKYCEVEPLGRFILCEGLINMQNI